jgi:hypothetical protein
MGECPKGEGVLRPGELSTERSEVYFKCPSSHESGDPDFQMISC